MAAEPNRPFSVPDLEDILLSTFVEPAQDPKSADTLPDLHPTVSQALVDRGFARLYQHQFEAIQAGLRGDDVLLSTATSSGKSLCFNSLVLHRLAEEPMARALYLYPTKALAQDQLGKLLDLAVDLDLHAAIYDGDTPQRQRGAIRTNAQAILSNPDMLHIGILPQHELWGKFLRALRVIVLDELHVYRGVFGSHVAWVLRRLLRLCKWYGSSPQIIACSATIANPRELFTSLTGRSAHLVSKDTAPKPGRTHFFTAPAEESPLTPNQWTARVMVQAAEAGDKTLAFCRSRAGCELVVRSARAYLVDQDSKLVESYRGGYTPAERRELEQAFFRGKLRALAATNAMELGVDVGDLDVVVVNGLPSSIASFRQQVGRCGRGAKPGVAFTIAHLDPLEHFLAANPAVLFDNSVEPATINPQNAYISASQLLCAAHERPIDETEFAEFPPKARQAAEDLVADGRLHQQRDRFFFAGFQSPAPFVNIRGASSDTVDLVVGDELLGTVELWRAYQETHTGAIYLHRGESYRVDKLDLPALRAHLRRLDVDYFTIPEVQSLVEETVQIEKESRGQSAVKLCGLKVTTLVTGYNILRWENRHEPEFHPLTLPPETISTVGVALEIDLPNIEESPEFAATVHALEHALLAVAPPLAGCDRNDLGSAWYSLFPTTMSPAIYLYDFTEGGIGLCETLYAKRDEWFTHAARLLRSCTCFEGCPKCLYRHGCEVKNEHLNKQGALHILDRWALRT
ncbi:MAG: DEAD/DEAH box helicase [Armatimonadetes bacterium]|nr:DEAD/DEAH box helicase [Armatimonadota bacterium]